MAVTLHHGDCLDVLRQMPAASVDAVVTDPPYGLAFMGKRWDYDVPSVDIWAECLRVLKPGGHLLAFAGTRTQHRMAVRIEDAGFEIRDLIAWVYGSGFPKSLDVSKAIDRMDASDEQARRRLRFTAWVRSTGATSRQIDDATGTKMGNHYTTHPSQPAIMTREHLEACRAFLGDVPAWVERECDIRTVESRNMAERQVVGVAEMRDTTEVRIAVTASADGYDAAARRVVPITAPATDAARQWAGWGTALKPALEPITVARKPLAGTVAETVLAYGTGAINVEAARCDGGRWPANLVHDGGPEVADLLGETARFFYCAKASRSDRDAGCDGLPQRTAAETVERAEGSAGLDSPRAGAGRTSGARNHHPTVKPTDLMRYLCRLVTQPGGVVLDPFMGSGSTGRGAVLEGSSFIGIEKELGYFQIANARILQAQSSAGFFSWL